MPEALGEGDLVGVSGYLKINRMAQFTAQEIIQAEGEVRLNSVSRRRHVRETVAFIRDYLRKWA